MEGYRKFLWGLGGGGGGEVKVKILEAKYEVKLAFPGGSDEVQGGGGGEETKNLWWGGVWIFSQTVHYFLNLVLTYI